MEKFFKLKENGTTVKTEVVAGITTFVTMAYILFANPSILSHGNPAISNGVFFATCLSSFIGTLLMGILAKLPFAQAPGMGLNAFFAFTVMPAMVSLSGNPDLPLVNQYQMALAIVFMSGLLFLVITVFGMREAIVKAIPKNIKIAISGGIGLLLAFLGLQTSGLVIKDETTLVKLISFNDFSSVESKNLVLGAVIALIGIIITTVLYKLRIKGSILIGIVVCSILAYFPFGVLSTSGFESVSFIDQAKDFMDVSFLKLDFGSIFTNKDLFTAISTVLTLIISFSLVDMFDTIGSLLGTAKKANLLDKDGNMPGIKGALLCDSIATSAGALVGSSTVTTYVESGSGIAEGGRTGLTSVVTSVLFLLSIFLAPVLGLIPAFATAPALIFVGALMMSNIKDVEFGDISESIPAFLTIAIMPLTNSIANGIAFGIISHVLIKLLTFKFKEINIINAIIALFFIIRYIFAV